VALLTDIARSKRERQAALHNYTEWFARQKVLTVFNEAETDAKAAAKEQECRGCGDLITVKQELGGTDQWDDGLWRRDALQLPLERWWPMLVQLQLQADISRSSAEVLNGYHETHDTPYTGERGAAAGAGGAGGAGAAGGAGDAGYYWRDLYNSSSTTTTTTTVSTTTSSTRKGIHHGLGEPLLYPQGVSVGAGRTDLSGLDENASSTASFFAQDNGTLGERTGELAINRLY
jgi:hypothetical protein